ncbi:MAG TPA: MoaD/ThiS family protein [Nitrospirota bacterium]|jgi:molybdopterin converting factor small subunit
MKIYLRLLASLKKHLPSKNGSDGSVIMDVEEGMSCTGLLESSGIDDSLVVLLNGRQADLRAVLKDGDVVAVFPPVEKGSYELKA